MIVPDKQKQISEAFRVLKKGSHAGFSVWGRKENTKMHTILSEVCKKYNMDDDENSNEIGENPEMLVSEFKKAGFEDIKFWYQAN
mmetsp:Transcript_20659/g.19666  ORF Transcript_20659/g.19666 Transcript_20659/m.19666 type:complete len:85 (+) Transcript_20659:484-738(+)